MDFTYHNNFTVVTITEVGREWQTIEVNKPHTNDR